MYIWVSSILNYFEIYDDKTADILLHKPLLRNKIKTLIHKRQTK